MKLGMQKKKILKLLGENDKKIKLRKIGGVVLVPPYEITCITLVYKTSTHLIAMYRYIR